MPPSFDDIFAIRLSLQDYVMDEFTIIKRLKIILQDYNMQLDEINQYLVDFYNSFGLTFTLEEIQNINVEANSLLSLFLTNGDIQMSINENNPEENINITNLLNNIINQSNTQGNIVENYQNSNDEVETNIPEINLPQTNFSEDPLPELNSNINSLPVFINDIQNIVPQNMILESEMNMFNTIINFINQPNQQLTQQDQNEFDEDVLVTLDQKEIDGLDKEVVETKQSDRCTICLQDIKEGETMTKLNCSHYYHHECIIKYLKDFDYKCPICRESVGATHAHV